MSDFTRQPIPELEPDYPPARTTWATLAERAAMIHAAQLAIDAIDNNNA